MNGEGNEGKKTAGGKRSLGPLSARKRAQLREFEERRKAAEDALRREQRALAEAVKDAEARERRRASTERRKIEGRVKIALGELVLGKLRAHPDNDLQFGKDDLNRLSEKDRERLAQALSWPTSGSQGGPGSPPDIQPDDGPPDVEV